MRMIVDYAHIVEMHVMEFSDEGVVIALDVDHLHPFIHALHYIIRHFGFLVCPFS